MHEYVTKSQNDSYVEVHFAFQLGFILSIFPNPQRESVRKYQCLPT